MKINRRVISIDVSTKHHVIKAERAQTKSWNGAIGYRRILPSVEITLPRDIIKETPSYTQCKCVSDKDKGVANQLPKNVQPQENNLFRSKTLSMKYVY